MRFYRNNFYRIIASPIFILFYLAVFSLSLYAEEPDYGIPETVKVGYYDNYIFQEGQSNIEVKNGYAYEYLRRVASITGWNYEYHYGSWGEIYKEFIEGKVDVIAGLSYDSDRLEYMFYPDFNMGRKSCYFYSNIKRQDITEDVSTFNNKNIGCLSGTDEKSLNEFLHNNNLKCYVYAFDDVRKRDRAFLEGRLDIVYGDAFSLNAYAEMIPVRKVSDNFMYLCVAKSRPDLLENLNKALYTLDTEDPYYVSDLERKWYSKTSLNNHLTPVERDYLAEDNVINVGYMNKMLPYCGTSDDGRAIGILVDVMNEILVKLNLTDQVKIKFYGFDSPYEIISYLKSDRLDIVFPVSGNTWFLELNGIFQSRQIMASNVAMIYKEGINENIFNKIAVWKNDYIMDEYVKINYPESRIVYYETLDDCLNAVRYDEVSCSLCNNFFVDNKLDHIRYKDLSCIILPQNISVCCGVNERGLTLLSILDKGINLLENDFLILSTYKTLDDNRCSVERFFSKYFVILFLILFIMLMCLLIFILLTISKTHKNLMLKKLAYIDTMSNLKNRSAYEEKITELSRSQSCRDLVYISVDINGLKRVNDTLGHLAGDQLIKGTSSILRSVFSEDCFIYRIGGDEFCVITSKEPKEVDKLLNNLNTLAQCWSGSLVKELSFSTGVAYMNSLSTFDIKELIRMADKEMYKNKKDYYEKSGHNQRH